LSAFGYVFSGLVRSSSRWLPPSHLILASGYGIGVLFSTAAAVEAASYGAFHLAWEAAWFRAVPLFVIAATSARQSPMFIYGLWLCSLLDVFIWAGLSSWYYHTPVKTVSTTGLLGVLLSALITGFRRRALKKSNKMMEKDQAQYDMLWASLTASDDAKACIYHLDKVVLMIGLDNSSYCFQHNRLRVQEGVSGSHNTMRLTKPSGSPLLLELGFEFWPGRADRMSRVDSLSQLYAAAAVANILIVERLKIWASKSNGIFKVAPLDPEGREPEYVKWQDIDNDPSMRERVLWAAVKRHGRAIEKLLRSYQQEHGRLLDISRNNIIFNDISDLTNCLGIIVTDSENVRVERIKNRMSFKYDSNETHGYRDVCINLSVVNAESFALGTELHQCEIQLVLQEFDKLRTNEGHKRYVAWRNMKGV